MRRQMTEEQKNIVAKVLKKVKRLQKGKPSKKGIFIDGPGGTGKTYTYRTLCHIFRGTGVKFMTMSWMGIASILLPEGQTMHKAMGLPVPLTKDSNSNVKVQSKQGKQLGANDVFIIDEAPMMPKYVLDIFDRKMREITQVEEPFGGKIIILGGDFRQCLPIKRYANRSELVNLSIRESELWNKNYFEVFKLRQNKRTLPEEQDFAEFLLKLGNGELETFEGIFLSF